MCGEESEWFVSLAKKWCREKGELLMLQSKSRVLLGTLLTCLIIGLIGAGGAWAQSVVINGVPLVTSRSPVTFGGSMLLPMRDVFEALNSEVKWFAAEQKVMAVRGQTVIELWINRTSATINGQPVNLPVAPSLIGGSTYVPLRFPAEAFGGTVKWDAPTRTAFIDIPPVGETPGTSTPVTDTPGTGTPAPPTQPEPTVVEGTVIQVIPSPAGLLLQAADTGGLQAVTVTATTVLTRGEAGAATQAAQMTDVRVGDYAVATLAGGNTATSVVLTYATVTGKVAAIAANTLVLDDGTALRIADGVRVFDAAGATMPLASLGANTPAQLILEPRSRVIWEIRVAGPAAATPPGTTQPGQVQILTVGVLNNTLYFRRGDTMRLQLTGTPAGQATISVGRFQRDVALPEVQPGVYQANITLQGNQELRNQAIVGNLTVGNVKAQPVTSQQRLVIDNKPPVIVGMLPAQGTTVANGNPTIEVAFQEDQGAPLNPLSVRLWVNRVEVTAALDADADDVVYVADNLRPGPVAVEVLVADMAGNETRANWDFTVGGATQNVIQAAWHDGRDTLVTGNTLTVSARVNNPGGVATFSLGDLRQGVAMLRVGTSNTYRGVYIVRRADRLVNGVVRVSYRDPQGNTATMDSTALLNIDTGLPGQLVIAQPADNSAVGDAIVVSGQAPPRSRVRVTISYSTRLITRITGQLWQGTLATSNRGLWRTAEVGSSIGWMGKADEYTVLAELLDAQGNVTGQQQIKLHK